MSNAPEEDYADAPDVERPSVAALVDMTGDAPDDDGARWDGADDDGSDEDDEHAGGDVA